MANTHASLTALFADIADAIREKTGDTGTIVADKFPGIIRDNLQLAPRKHCLTFSSPSSFSIKTYNTSKNWDGVLEYSTDRFNWTEWDGSEIAAAAVGDGYELYISGTGNTKLCGGNQKRWVITGSGVACTGNIETLLDYKTVKSGQHPTMANSCYSMLFLRCASLISAPELPATSLTDGCYSSMFSSCTGLISAPELPATSLTDRCYDFMFEECTSLTKAPALPATVLATNCYQSMFSGCTSLTKAPALPATTLTDFCYYTMFYGCTSLADIPALPATVLATRCYQGMFSGCTSLKLSSTKTGEYTVAYRIPTTGTGTTATNALASMFTNTGGTFTGTLEINTTYYLSNTNTVV